jgi:hypothetical protein
MDTVVRAVIEAIHSSPTHVVLCLSGGAAQVSFAIRISLRRSILYIVDISYLNSTEL